VPFTSRHCTGSVGQFPFRSVCMELLGPRAKKRVAKFQALANALVESWPSWEARKQNDFSTAHPTHYLNVTIGKPYVRARPRVQVCSATVTVVSLQAAETADSQAGNAT
jgi:hypothetical protein